MDIQRESVKKKRIIRRIVYITISVVMITIITAALSQLEPAAPVVDRATIWIGTVERNDMVRAVRGPGSLVPVDIRWIAPQTAGRVERILIRPGTFVNKDSVIIELSNPELELEAEDAKLKVKAAELQLASRKVELENQLLDLESSTARVEADLAEAKLRAQSDAELAKDGLISHLQLKVSQVRADELEKLKKIEEKRETFLSELAKTQLEVLQAQVEQSRALSALKQQQVESLQVTAGFAGVLEQLLVEEGHQVSSTTNLAKVSDPTKLKAVLRIDQNQAREVLINQAAEIDLRSSILKGHVTRIDPSVQEGTVNVDVMLDDPLSQGARPDQTLDGTIEIEKLKNILFVGRPVFGQSNAVISLFKLTPDQQMAERVRVTLGRTSVNTIEVIEGLEVGDRIILSDMNEWDEADTIRLR
ncbi:MAG: HlyD family efflux transporter periplasmic adaptor subunit [Candidatus Omnitrophota bacterium]|jgi:HlyD family secretion protein|nr:MAG: HlyD family efflux transporter periplasmic adaptor subunit [Candidatus Omnitrophota bacterium]